MLSVNAGSLRARAIILAILRGSGFFPKHIKLRRIDVASPFDIPTQ